MIVQDVIQKVQLVEGSFSASHAAQVITSLLDAKINFHKLVKLSACIGEQEADFEHIEKRIAELEIEKQVAQELIKDARVNLKNIRINGTLEMTFVKEEPKLVSEAEAAH